MALIRIPQENVTEQLSTKGLDLFKWLSQLNQKIIYVGREPHKEFFQFDLFKEYQEIKTNDKKFFYVPSDDLEEVLTALKNKSPSRTRTFKLVLHLVLDDQRNFCLAEVLAQCDVAFFYRKSDEDTTKDIDAIAGSVMFQNQPMCVNVVDQINPLIELLCLQGLDIENKFKYTISPLQREDRIIDVLGIFSSTFQEFHMEVIAKILKDFDEIIIKFFDFCRDKNYLPFLAQSNSKGP